MSATLSVGRVVGGTKKAPMDQKTRWPIEAVVFKAPAIPPWIIAGASTNETYPYSTIQRCRLA